MVAALCATMPPQVSAQGPRKEVPSEVVRYTIPQAVLDNPFHFAGESVPIRRRDVRHRIESQMNFLLMDARGVLTEWLSERRQYSWLFEETFAKEGLPGDFASLAPVIAGLNIFASTRGQSVGWWGLPSLCTADEGIELSADSWHDDRLDLDLSTRCFASRIKSLKKELGARGWLMPVAAYLTSLKTIQDLQQRWNTTIFWDLPLPEAAEEVITRWIAFAIIDTNRARFGLHFKETPPLTFDQVSGVVLSKDLSIADIARMTGTPPREILKLNAKIKGFPPVFPALVQGKQPSHCIAAPKGKGKAFVESLQKEGYLADPRKP
jgi:hypothetical protein